MTDESSRRRSPLWMMGCMVLVAWIACGVYRRQTPPLTVVRAVLQVPSATDLGTLSQQPDIYQAAVKQLEADGDLYINFEHQAGTPRLSGKLTATKLKSGPHPATLAPQLSTETWELSYRTPRPERALGELSALIAVLEPRVAPASAKSATDDRAAAQLGQLETKRNALQVELEKLAPEAGAAVADPIQLANLKDRVQSLQRALTESQVKRLQLEEEWRLVEQEVGLNPRLEATVAKLSAGPVQEAVLQIDRQRKLSAELKRLNDTEQRLGNVYGDKHPKLVELRQKFEQVLSDLGGWDQVLDENQVAERLRTSLEQLLALKLQHATDLETQLALEQQELAAVSQQTERRSALTTQLEQLDRELAATRPTAATGTVAGLSEFAVQQAPEVMAPHWSSHFAVLMALATAGGLIAGGLLHRLRSNPSYRESDDSDPRATPAFTPLPETQLDLAQRRAVRQARLQQVYAG